MHYNKDDTVKLPGDTLKSLITASNRSQEKQLNVKQLEALDLATAYRQIQLIVQDNKLKLDIVIPCFHCKHTTCRGCHPFDNSNSTDSSIETLYEPESDC